MDRHTICFATSGNLTGSRARWGKPLEMAWPSPDQLELVSLGLDPLLAALFAKSAGQPGQRVTAALIVLGPSEPSRDIDRLIEALGAASVPAIFLMQDPSAWRPFQRHGVLFESLETDPVILAAMLYALAERQSAIELLSREVVLSHRCQGGIRSEMDRIHEELHLAAAIQREFTSAPLPKIEGLEFGVLFRPVNFVSGDIYNVRPLGDGKAAFFLADAVGHGVPAALLTMVLTSSLITTEATPNAGLRVLDPSEVLSRLNDRLCRSCLGSGRFATALYGVIDSRTREVKVAGAGHPWPLVVTKKGAREVRTEGPLLGVFPGADFTQATVALGDDETLLLYTDGFEAIFPARAVAEAPDNPDQWQGREYLGDISRLVGAAREGDLTHVLGQLEALLDEQSGSLHQADDVTALAISPSKAAGSLPKK